MAWPQTSADFHDRDFFMSPPSGVSPRYVEMWRERKICGCGDLLTSDQERADGVCAVCKLTGLRTPRP